MEIRRFFEDEVPEDFYDQKKDKGIYDREESLL